MEGETATATLTWQRQRVKQLATLTWQRQWRVKQLYSYTDLAETEGETASNTDLAETEGETASNTDLAETEGENS